MIKYLFAWPLLASMALVVLASLLIGLLAIGLLSLLLAPFPGLTVNSKKVFKSKTDYHYGLK